ncbi:MULTISPECIES: PucR family transcriptional regulator [unclassified Mycobacterium]|uniref:PucR family transcriptional regulator n=1 Tax=unclassified Mycobacterium TaxID=2642494 RepID=UPI0029C6AC89|nr:MULTISPECIES: helix-turn-helix domain-containing protein [unclassified Mycobacterium]
MESAPQEALAWITPNSDAEIDELAAMFLAAITDALPALAEDPELSRDLTASTRAQVRAFIVWMTYGAAGEPVIPVQAHALAQTLARRGLDADVLTEIHRATQHAQLRYLIEQTGRLPEREEQVSLLVLFIDRGLSWLSTSLNVLTQTYREERERLFAGVLARRAEVVRSILLGEPVSVESASGVLGYPLRGHHTAVVISTDDRTGTDIDRRLVALAHTVGDHLGASTVLTTQSGAHGVWAWLGSDRPLELAELGALAQSREVRGVRAGIGITGHRISGFIRSHHEAVAAYQISTTTSQPTGSFTCYRDVELQYLVTADAQAYAAFQSRTLSGLTAADDTAGRLRETLRTYIACGRNRDATAAALGVHKNTVRYRLERARNALGHDVDSHLVELQLALLGTAVGPEEVSRSRDRDPQG